MFWPPNDSFTILEPQNFKSFRSLVSFTVAKTEKFGWAWYSVIAHFARDVFNEKIDKRRRRDEKAEANQKSNQAWEMNENQAGLRQSFDHR